jgi:hypothetical protein
MRFVIAIIAALLLSIPAQATEKRPIPEDEWTPEARVWLARSVVGEAGWRTFNEYSAIAWIYAIRSQQSEQYSFLKMIRTYSAAVRRRKNPDRPWLYELGPMAQRPRSWPSGPLWAGLHEVAWKETLLWADSWARGERPNPCPGANHFGGLIDHHRAVAKRWTRIRCKSKMRNRFYTSLRLQPKVRPTAKRWRFRNLGG